MKKTALLKLDRVEFTSGNMYICAKKSNSKKCYVKLLLNVCDTIAKNMKVLGRE